MDPEGRFRVVNGEPTVNFGKNRGRTLKEMSQQEPGFLRWVIKGDFSAPVKEIARRYLPEQEGPRLPLSHTPASSPSQSPDRGSEGETGDPS
jgi:hypothetical protein